MWQSYCSLTANLKICEYGLPSAADMMTPTVQVLVMVMVQVPTVPADTIVDTTPSKDKGSFVM
jgi:hypothetical protein